MMHPQGPVKLVTSLLAFTLALFGVHPPATCNMDHDSGIGPTHACCDADRSMAVGDVPQCAPVPADCCAVSAPANRQPPAQPVGTSNGASVRPLDGSRLVVPAVLHTRVPVSAGGPPAAGGVARHLLLSVFLI